MRLRAAYRTDDLGGLEWVSINTDYRLHLALATIDLIAGFSGHIVSQEPIRFCGIEIKVDLQTASCCTPQRSPQPASWRPTAYQPSPAGAFAAAATSAAVTTALDNRPGVTTNAFDCWKGHRWYDRLRCTRSVAAVRCNATEITRTHSLPPSVIKGIVRE